MQYTWRSMPHGVEPDMLIGRLRFSVSRRREISQVKVNKKIFFRSRVDNTLVNLVRGNVCQLFLHIFLASRTIVVKAVTIYPRVSLFFGHFGD